MSVTFDQFLAGLRQQESSGDYSAVNSIGATGAYQVMPANIGPWTQAALGHAETQQQFLADHAGQDKTAAYELAPYFSKYGAAGAASWWYSGDATLAGSNRSQSGGPSIAEYVREVLAHASGASPAAAGGISAAPVGLVSDVGGAITGGVGSFLKGFLVIAVKGALLLAGVALVVVGVAALGRRTA